MVVAGARSSEAGVGAGVDEAHHHRLAGLEATLVPADPPRLTWLALWSPDGIVPGADGSATLVLPAGSTVRRRTVPVRSVPAADLLVDLVTLPAEAPVGRSVRMWSVAARLALDLVARGRLAPGVTAAGYDAWHLGPFDPDDLRRWAELAAALPPEGYCRPVGTGSPLRLPSPHEMVRAFGEAVADSCPRTAAAERVAGHRAFAGSEPEPVAGYAEWLTAAGPGRHDATVILRLCPPGDPDLDDPDLDDPDLDDPDLDDLVDPADGRDPDGPDGDQPFSAELVLQSADDPSLVVGADELWSGPEVVMRHFADAEATVLLTLRRAARVWPPVERLLRQARPVRLVLDDAECDQLLGPVADDLAAAGLWVQWPAELLAPLEVRPQISSPSVGREADAGLTLDVVLAWRASVGGVDLTEQELEQLASAKRSVVRLRGRWVRADPELLRRLAERRSLPAGPALGAALGGTIVVDGEAIEAEVIGPLAELGRRLAALDTDRRQLEPPDLNAELRPYQRRGLAWLVEMATLGLGGILADDMGLGKTIQLLALHLHLHLAPPGAGPARPTLVVCPATLLANWEREAAKFAPDVVVRRYHGRDRSLAELGPGEIVVTTYGVVRRDREALAAVDWGVVAADEAQAVKNPLSRSARSLRHLDAGVRFALTGTPVENQLSELWALCDWTTPGLLGDLEQFRRDVAIPVERHGDADTASRLATLIRPFVLRRRKSDPGIAPELPPKTETDRVVALTTEQITLYKAVVDESLELIATTEGIHRRGLVLKLLTELKQICNHPAHYLKQPSPLAHRSAKLDAATELVSIVADEGEAALMFTQYVEMGKLLRSHLESRGMRVGFLTGSLALPRRQELVDRFQGGEIDVFILSLKAGGTGLNLTRASHVVHYDRWWNPAVEDQASDRAWRIGQDKPVQIHRLVCEGTIEDRIADLLRTKRELAERVVGGGEAWISELDDRELAALVAFSGAAGGGS